MKIVDVAEFYGEQGGGVRTYINQKLQASACEGHYTVIVAPGAEDRDDIHPGGKIVWVRGPRHPLDHRYRCFPHQDRVLDVLDREAPNVVEGSSPWKGGWIASRWVGPAVKSFFVHQDPVAVYPQTFLGHIIGQDRVDRTCGWFWTYLRKLSSRFDTSIVSGEWLANRLAAFGLRRPYAVPFGIEKSLFSPAKRDIRVRHYMLDQCRITDRDATVLIAVSRHHPEKRLGTMIKAFRALRRHRSVGLFLIGDGPIRHWVEFKARNVPGVYIAGRVGDRDQLAAFLASADVMIHAGAAETYGLAVAEAICSGLPVVVPNSGGAAELTLPGYAETYPAGDAAAFTDAVQRLLLRDRDALKCQALQAASDIICTPQQHFQALFAHYQNLVATRSMVS